MKPAAIDAAREVASLSAEYLKAERDRQKAVGQAEILQANTRLSQTTVAMELAEVKSRTAFRTLASACVEAEFVPQGLAELYEEIRRVQSV